MKIYTKTGDLGETSLFDGTRVSKDHLRVEAYGDVDELNACVGVVIAQINSNFSAGFDTFALDQTHALRLLLLEIQRRLFNVGAILADPKRRSPKQDKEAIRDQDVEALERAMDAWEAVLPPLHAFILPGGVQAAAHLHVARTVCRRAERRVMVLHHVEPVSADVIRYLNRLSDFLFVAARFVNFLETTVEETW